MSSVSTPGRWARRGNCQIGVSVHAVGARGTVPLGWALYLPEDWCEDAERRRKAKIPAEVEFKTKPELGVELVERAAGWAVPSAPVLGDHAYGENTWLRDRLDEAGCEYVLSIGAKTKVFEQGTGFAVPARTSGDGRAPWRPRPDRKSKPIGDLIGDLASDAQIVTFRDGPDGDPVSSRFIFARVHAAHGWRDDARRQGWREGSEVPPREEWLIAEWPEDHDEPTDYWISNLPADTDARAARQAGTDALEDGARLQATQRRARPGPLRRPLLAWLVSPHRDGDRRPRVSHPRAAEPFSPAAGLTLPKAVLLLQPLFKCWTGRCRTCQRPINVDRLPLTPDRHDE